MLTLKSEITVFSFSGIYDYESFYLEDKGSFNVDKRAMVVDLRTIPGTNCMCDDLAVTQIKKAFIENKVEQEAIHFIDSGNYHYMSCLLTELVTKPFSLVVLDHHPDMQPPMFGDILSCGGWVKKVMDNNPNVKDIHIIGADRKLIEQLDEEDKKRVRFYDLEDVYDGKLKLPETGYPVYLSVDKDVVRRDELITNWDQGEMPAEVLVMFIKEICAKKDLLGIDICGECGTEEEGGFFEATRGNDELNKVILETILKEIC